MRPKSDRSEPFRSLPRAPGPQGPKPRLLWPVRQQCKFRRKLVSDLFLLEKGVACLFLGEKKASLSKNASLVSLFFTDEEQPLTAILSRHFLSFLQKSIVIYLQRCLFWSFETFCGWSSLRNNELHLLQVVASFLDNTYFGEDARNCAVYKANKTLLPLHCGSKREWICKIPRGKNINKIFTIRLLSNNLQHFSKWGFTEI